MNKKEQLEQRIKQLEAEPEMYGTRVLRNIIGDEAVDRAIAQQQEEVKRLKEELKNL